MTELRFTQKSFDLLVELADNNNRAWYEDHRKEFETYLRKPFAEVLEYSTDELSEMEVPLIGNRKTMFRQHRDIRFSKDKSPYSTHVSGVLTPSGTKAEKAGLVYVHLDSEGGFIACGFYQLKATELAPIRDRILAKPKEFAGVLKDLTQADLSLSDEDTLTTMPRGYKEYEDHDYAHYLKLKSLIVQTKLDRDAWLSGEIVDYIVKFANGGASLLAFGRAAKAEAALT